MKISHLNKDFRFIKQIKKEFEPAEATPDSSLIDWLTERLAGESVAQGGQWSTAPDRLHHIPSILPVRIVQRAQYRVSSWFGLRCHPVTGRQQSHNGIDFPQPVGTPVYATADGYVSRVDLLSDGLGLSIQLVHPSGFTTTYGHLSSYEVQRGQQVRRGQQIGRVGQTGVTTGPHLHYIVRYQGRAIDPKRYCFLAVKE